MKARLKLTYKSVVAVLSMVLAVMMAATLIVYRDGINEAHAEELTEDENLTDPPEARDGSGEGDDEEDDDEEDDDEEEPAAVCICDDKCGVYDYNKSCEVCASDHQLCAYKRPNVVISINNPSGWYRDSATVNFAVSDALQTGNFAVAKIEARIGQSGSWIDVTEDRRLTVSENCTVYVLVTDQKGKTYEKNRAIRCFDNTKPTVNAAVDDGLLSIRVYDNDSGAKAVYVNGHEFDNLTNGTLNVRLQKFDAGYEYFTIYAMDNAGNMSDVYKTKNPYYTSDEAEKDKTAALLPVSAQPTSPTTAQAKVTEHRETTGDGKVVISDTGDKKTTDPEREREFYTIQTASEKVFYLVIDRDGDEETAYFLTEISENDLLNVTTDNSEVLPKNSAAIDSGLPVKESVLPESLPEKTDEAAIEEEPEDTGKTDEPENENTEGEEETKEKSSAVSYVIIGLIAIAVIGAAYYFKIVRKKKDDFIEDEDDDDEDDDYPEEPDDETDDFEDEFFDKQEDEE